MIREGSIKHVTRHSTTAINPLEATDADLELGGRVDVENFHAALVGVVAGLPEKTRDGVLALVRERGLAAAGRKCPTGGTLRNCGTG